MAEPVPNIIAEQWGRKAHELVILDLPYPPSVNRLWQRTATGMARSPRYETWFRAAGNRVNEQRPGRVRGEYALSVMLGRPDRRTRDLDNTIKAVSDLLVEHRIIDDDSLARKISLEWSDEVEGAHVTLYSWRAA